MMELVVYPSILLEGCGRSHGAAIWQYANWCANPQGKALVGNSGEITPPGSRRAQEWEASLLPNLKPGYPLGLRP